VHSAPFFDRQLVPCPAALALPTRNLGRQVLFSSPLSTLPTMTLQQPASAEKPLRKIDIAQVRLTQGDRRIKTSKWKREKMNAPGGPAWVAWQEKGPKHLALLECLG